MYTYIDIYTDTYTHRSSGKIWKSHYKFRAKLRKFRLTRNSLMKANFNCAELQKKVFFLYKSRNYNDI